MDIMGTQSTLLCIHRDPGQLLHLEEQGYGLITATNGGEGLRLLMSRTVDAVVIEYHLGLLDGAVVASEIKKVKPQLPVVMVCDNLELPEEAWKSVDAIVIRSDGQHFLVATIHFVLSIEWTKQHTARAAAAGRPFNRLGIGRPRRTTSSRAPRSSAEGENPPLSSRQRRRILDGMIQF
jgi:DNA-binding NarL/FixJ family response regulator